MDCGRLRFEREPAAVFFDEHRHGQEWLENAFFTSHGTGAGTAAAVRRGKSLVQIQVHDVDAEIAGPGDAGQRVHVGAVHVEQGALAWRSSAISANLLLEDAERGRIGEHERGDVVVHLLAADARCRSGRGIGLNVLALRIRR